MINELSLNHFRGFESLGLQGLKQVNLIVGQNNTGKTSLLEALLLLCQPDRLGQLPGLFRPVQGSPVTRFFPWLVRDGLYEGDTLLQCKSPTILFQLLVRHNSRHHSAQIPANFYGPLTTNSPGLSLWSTRTPIDSANCRVISVVHRDPNTFVQLIGKAYRKKGGEEKLQKLLAKVDQRINKIRIDPGDDGNQVIVDIGLSELLPLSQVGQGVYRLASILADIIGEDPNILLIDEIENGLHHSVLQQVWSGLAETAAELNVQIFASTHSGECLLAAHKAFQKRPKYDLAIIQLFRNERGVQGRVVDQEHIEAAIAADIELR